MFSRIVGLGVATAIIIINLPVQGETCKPLSLIGGTGSVVTKTVSPPTIPGPFGLNITRNNWNTDWSVPGGTPIFSRFIVTITSNDGGPFDIRFFLRYSDQTAGEFFNQQGVQFIPEKPLVIEAETRPNDQPYIVNLFVNGIQGIGKTYTASVVGCY